MTPTTCADAIELILKRQGTPEEISPIHQSLVLTEAVALLRASTTKANFKPWLETHHSSVYREKLK